MADTTPPKPKTKEEALSHLFQVEEAVKQFAGKPGRNPFLFVSRTINPLKVKLASKEATQADIDNAFKVTAEEKNVTFEPPKIIAPSGTKLVEAEPGKTVVKPVG